MTDKVDDTLKQLAMLSEDEKRKAFEAKTERRTSESCSA